MRPVATQWSWIDECSSASEITEEHIRSVYYASSNTDSVKPHCPSIDELGFGDRETLSANADNERKQLLEKQRAHCQKRCLAPFGSASTSNVGNPNCLNLLGQQQWEDEDKSFREYCAARLEARNLPDPLAMSRNPKTPVGLKNLGATCYLNAFLQTWFHIDQFRAGVYQIPVSDPMSPIYQLQLLFGHLQGGLQKYYNPKPFVESMGLAETEQQDANEFYRLFVGLLEHQIEDFRLGGHGSVVNFVSDLLGGTYAHSTQCKNCNTKSTRPEVFSQFELHIKDRITLDQCLKDYLREELLDGSNQYHCSVCGSKQDALRFTELRKLPRLLNFQLMRFVIDMQSENFHKKKTNHLIKFPLTIDMREYMAKGFASAEESFIYDLKSVLLHRGESAYRGHYMAHVYDSDRKTWFRFNDEEVEDLTSLDRRYMFDISDTCTEKPIPTSSATKDSQITVASPTTPSASAKKSTAAASSAASLFSSRNTYMLIYEKRQEPRQNNRVSAALSGSTTIPPAIANSVDADNKQFLGEIEQRSKQNESMRHEFIRLRQERLAVITMWRLKSADDPSYFVPSEWLSDWLSRPFRSDFDASDFQQQAIDLRLFLCKHDSLDFHSVNRMKRISKSAGDFLFSDNSGMQQARYQFNPPTPLNDELAICAPCVREEYHKRTFLERHGQMADDLHVMIRQYEIALNTKRRKSTVAEKIFMSSRRSGASCDNVEDDTAVWISKRWLKEWMKKTPFADVKQDLHAPSDNTTINRVPLPTDQPYVSDVYCEHGRLALDLSSRRLIPVRAWEFLLNQVEGLKNALDAFPRKPLLDSDSECPKCTKIDAEQSEMDSERKQEAKREKLILKDLVTGCRPLSLLFTTSVSKAVSSNSNNNDGNVEINSRRKSLPELPALAAGDTYYALSTKFLNQWRRWLDSPNRNERPQFVDNTDLLCEHNKLRFDINQLQNEQGWLSEPDNRLPWESAAVAAMTAEEPLNSPLLFRPPLPVLSDKKLFDPLELPPFVLVTGREWGALKDLYAGQAGPAIRVVGRKLELVDVESGGMFQLDFALASQERDVDDNSANKIVECLPCWQCSWQERFDWVEATINIRRINAQPADLERLANELSSRPAPRLVYSPQEQQQQQQQTSAVENRYNPAPPRRRGTRRKAAAASRRLMVLNSSDLDSSDLSSPPEFDSDMEVLGNKQQPKKSTVKGNKMPAAKTESTTTVQLDIKSFLVPSNKFSSLVVTPSAAPTVSLGTKRSSTRARNKSGCKLSVLKGDTVKDLKVRIMCELNITPIYQRLFYMGQEWKDNESTMEGLHIMPNGIVDLLVLNPDQEEMSEDDHAQREEAGFRGTLLYSITNTASTPHQRSREQSITPPLVGAENDGYQVAASTVERAANSAAITKDSNDDIAVITIDGLYNGSNVDIQPEISSSGGAVAVAEAAAENGAGPPSKRPKRNRPPPKPKSSNHNNNNKSRGKQWSCSQCTLLNNPRFSICTACGLRRA